MLIVIVAENNYIQTSYGVPGLGVFPEVPARICIDASSCVISQDMLAEDMSIVFTSSTVACVKKSENHIGEPGFVDNYYCGGNFFVQACRSEEKKMNVGTIIQAFK